MKKIRVYLAGTIYNNEPGFSWKNRFIDELNGKIQFNPKPSCNCERGTSWREDLFDLYECFDPNPSNECNNTMIARDKAEIQKSDIFVAYIEKFSCGTSMEILCAYNQQTIPIFIINPGLNFSNDLWLKYHSHLICNTVIDCSEHIKEIKF
jgi:nucleoside 2-deoxyribosyltransferase